MSGSQPALEGKRGSREHYNQKELHVWDPEKRSLKWKKVSVIGESGPRKRIAGSETAQVGRRLLSARHQGQEMHNVAFVP